MRFKIIRLGVSHTGRTYYGLINENGEIISEISTDELMAEANIFEWELS